MHKHNPNSLWVCVCNFVFIAAASLVRSSRKVHVQPKHELTQRGTHARASHKHIGSAAWHAPFLMQLINYHHTAINKHTHTCGYPHIHTSMHGATRDGYDARARIQTTRGAQHFDMEPARRRNVSRLGFRWRRFICRRIDFVHIYFISGYIHKTHTRVSDLDANVRGFRETAREFRTTAMLTRQQPWSGFEHKQHSGWYGVLRSYCYVFLGASRCRDSRRMLRIVYIGAMSWNICFTRLIYVTGWIT